jgi:hypothetical protein
MPTKPKRTDRELQALIMQEVRRRPECRNIKGVAIIRPVQMAAHHPNWDFSWFLDGPGIAPLSATEVAQKLGNEFDLADG